MILMLGVKTMELFSRKIDPDKTAAKAFQFLNSDFQEIRNYAGMRATDLSSPLIDPSGVINHSSVNHQDEAFHAQALQYKGIEVCRHSVNSVLETIKACSNGPRKPYGTLLYLRFVKYDFDTNVYTKMDISSSSYYKFRRYALIQFAEILPSKQLQYQKDYRIHINNWNLYPDLLVYS